MQPMWAIGHIKPPVVPTSDSLWQDAFHTIVNGLMAVKPKLHCHKWRPGLDRDSHFWFLNWMVFVQTPEETALETKMHNKGVIGERRQESLVFCFTMQFWKLLLASRQLPTTVSWKTVCRKVWTWTTLNISYGSKRVFHCLCEVNCTHKLWCVTGSIITVTGHLLEVLLVQYISVMLLQFYELCFKLWFKSLLVFTSFIFACAVAHSYLLRLASDPCNSIDLLHRCHFPVTHLLKGQVLLCRKYHLFWTGKKNNLFGQWFFFPSKTIRNFFSHSTSNSLQV